MNNKTTKIFAMPNVQELGQKIAEELEMKLSKLTHIQFADGESILSANETVRNKNVFIVASTSIPVNENVMQLLLFVDSLKRASAKTITVALSYYGYSRQDRKAAGRQPIGAKLFADILEKAGVTKVITVDLHNASIQGFFNIPLDDLKGQYILAQEIKKAGKFTIVSPDHGGAVRARVLAELISNTVDIAIVDKRRTGTNTAETMGVLGNVKNRDVVILDDMIDTGGTIIKAAESIKKEGARSIFVAATHGIFTKGFDMFDNSKYIDRVIVTDSIPSVSKINSKKITIVSLASFLSLAIKATAESHSISHQYNLLKKRIKY
ncbi:MAG: ribose-phosphate pyrophosphokinase [Mycoplasmatales bacterium]|nr:ribose-phosphate pyrophosphokinase [Mycoplasmatales bacterium]